MADAAWHTLNDAGPCVPCNTNDDSGGMNGMDGMDGMDGMEGGGGGGGSAGDGKTTTTSAYPAIWGGRDEDCAFAGSRDAPADNMECALNQLAHTTDALARSCEVFIRNIDKLLTQGGRL